MADKSGKTEKPTPRRLEKARKEGRFFSSRELVAALQFVLFLLILGAATPPWLATLKQATRFAIEQGFRRDLDTAAFLTLARYLATHVVAPLATAAVILLAATLAIQLALTKMGLSLKRLSPDWQKLNPISRFGEVRRQALPNLLQAVAMLVGFALAIYGLAKESVADFYRLPLAGLGAGLGRAAGAVDKLLWRAGGLFLVLGVIDLARQRYRYVKDLRMSKQEVKDEHKETEGNPMMKARVRRIQRDLARKRMMKAVPTATAVVVNPTHFAVALRYDHETMITPVVVAKGKNYLAARIRQLAVHHGVPLIENPPLAQALYKSVNVGQEIPPHLYRAVAEILAYVYRLVRGR